MGLIPNGGSEAHGGWPVWNIGWYVALTALGFKVSAATLTTKACRGGGPPYQLFGQRTLYRWGDTLAWARARLSAPRRSAAEHAAEDNAA